MNPTRMIFADQIRNGMVLATKCGRAECCPWPATPLSASSSASRSRRRNGHEGQREPLTAPARIRTTTTKEHL